MTIWGKPLYHIDGKSNVVHKLSNFRASPLELSGLLRKEESAMNVNIAIGAKVKQRRTEKKMTLKQLGEKTGLSVGFLSQFERGLSSIALDSLEKISRVLEVPLSDLFEEHENPSSSDPVIHGMALRCESINERVYQNDLKTPGENFQMVPKIMTLLPLPADAEMPQMSSHDGEEFIFALEGVVTFIMENKEYTLYPGDSIHIRAKKDHCCVNRTGRIAKYLIINMSNPQS